MVYFVKFFLCLNVCLTLTVTPTRKSLWVYASSSWLPVENCSLVFINLVYFSANRTTSLVNTLFVCKIKNAFRRESQLL